MGPFGKKTSTTSVENSLEISASSLTLETGSAIKATGRGYQAATTTARSRTLGNLEQTTIGNGSSSAVYVGGSHGGRGGANGTSGMTDQFATYGNPLNPYYSGGSGILGSSGLGSYKSLAGGGIIRISTGSGAAVIDGTIDASGEPGSNCTSTFALVALAARFISRSEGFQDWAP